MAFSTKQVYIDTTQINSAKVPSGHSVNTAEASLGTADITETYSWSITASDAVQTTAAAGFDDLLKVELVADIDAFIDAASGLGQVSGTNTISYNAKVTDIKYGSAPSEMYRTSANVSFIVSFQLRVYIS